MPDTATKTETEWDVELSHLRFTTRRHHRGVRARRVEYKRVDGWMQWLHYDIFTVELKADTMPELREKAEEVNRDAKYYARAEEMETAVSRKRRKERAERRKEARERFAEVCLDEWGHLYQAYTRSIDRYADTGAPDPQRRERPFREWLDLYFRREDQQELRRFRDRWASIREAHDLPSDTHYL